MPTALPSIVKSPYVSKLEKDKPKEEQTTWMLQPLNGLQHMQVSSGVFGVDYSGALAVGLTGWENFKDENGVEIEFSNENISRVPALYLQDIALEILKRSEMKDEKVKNS